jgi:hypothetical protein
VSDLTARVRKLIGGVGILAFIALWVWAMTAIGAHLPQHWAVQIAFYAVAGIGWGIPILPLLSWMNRGR